MRTTPADEHEATGRSLRDVLRTLRTPTPTELKFIGQALRKARQKSGLTQTDVSKAVSIHQGTLSRIERGLIAEPNAGVILEISDVVGCNLAFLAAADRKPRLVEKVAS